MAEKKIDLKQKVGNDFVDIHPTTKWANIKDKPTTFTPTAHTHTISNITNLQETINLLARTDANTQTFTGVNTFTQTVNLNRSGSSTTDPALTFNIGQNGSARIRVEPTTNPEQSPTTFNLQPTYLGGEEQLLHTGNVKTINTESIFGSGNITINASSVSYSNTTSGLTTTTVQGAIDELAGVFASKQEVEDAFDELATLMEGV